MIQFSFRDENLLNMNTRQSELLDVTEGIFEKLNENSTKRKPCIARKQRK